DDRGRDRRPEKPRPQKLKSGTRIVPAAAPSGWVIGSRIGGAIRRYRDGEDQGGTHAGPRPHVRRAHWHHFWTGPRTGTRRLVLHWLPPIPVGIAGGELPVTVHPVQG